MEQAVFVRAISTLLVELFDGPPKDGFVLNPGDVGLLRQLDGISVEAASQRLNGRATIAAHVDHVTFGLSLLNRWAGGEENPFATADWDQSWKRTAVNEAEWRKLRDGLRDQARAWQGAVGGVSKWDDVATAGTIGSVAHTAYHLAAIRHILASQR
jgi:hypothetical protein